MSPARKTFLVILGLSIALGLIVGIIKLVAPDAASVSLNGEEVTGFKAVVTSTVLGGVLGLVFGLIIAGIVKLATRGMRKAA